MAFHRRKGRMRASHIEAARKMRSNPRVWVAIGVYPATYSADRIAHEVRTGSMTVYEPAGAFQAKTVLLDDGTKVFGRYIGTATPVAADAPITECTVTSCGEPPLARGWCEAHYRRWRRHGDPLGGRHFCTECRVTGCPEPHSAKGYCATHYRRWKRYGDPEYLPGRDIDEMAVDRAVAGDPPARLTTPEREEAVRRLHRRGLHDSQIAERVGLGASGVWTIRQRLGLPANRPGEPVGDFTGRLR